MKTTSVLSLDADTSVASAITRALSARIVSGSLPPGARLLQDQIAAEFGVSHVPVREAFRKLEAQRLAVSVPRRGVRVSDIEPARVHEVTEMRAVLEGLALSHAVPRIEQADLDEARAALAQTQASDQIAVWEAANRRFHIAITSPCAMPRLMDAIRDLHQSDARFLFATWTSLDWQPRSDAEHWAILNAVEQRDVARARELLEAHVREAGSALVERLRTMTPQQSVA